ncbi:MAG: HAD-IC family P-type ATPase, partial [Candidatus Curtissbacteria bacterium]|nr:HAD-IC family P-type ATPase [Candidatus Curtissbacteria bacterium]
MDCCEDKENKEIGKGKKPKHEHNMSHGGGHCGSDSGHGHSGGMGMDHGSAGMYLRRFWTVTVLLLPLLFTNEKLAGFFGLNTLPYSKWIGFGIATVIFGFSIIFFQHAGHEIRAKKYGMMTLVSLAVGAGYLFSVASTFIPALEAEFYLEISTLIWVLLFGHFLEAKSGSAAGDALSEVAKLLPKNAHRLIREDAGHTSTTLSTSRVRGIERQSLKEEEVDVDELRKGDLVLVKPGEKIPADGIIKDGSANINESHITGESKPIHKKEGDEVSAGSICEDGSIRVELSEVGENSTIGQIKKLIAKAQESKPRSQKIADKAAGILTFIAFGTSLLTILVWSFVLNEPFVFSITLAITVLVIA